MPVSPSSTPGPEPTQSAPVTPEAAALSASAAAPPTEATSAAPPEPPRPEIDVPATRAKLLKAAAIKDWKSGEAALLALAEGQPSALRAQVVASAAKDVLIALERKGNGRSDRVFEALAERSGSDGLDLLYDVVESRGRAAEAKHAAAILAKPEIQARATPALRFAFELREAPCAKKLDLLSRAESEGDGRALVVLETSGPPCFGQSPKDMARVEAVAKSLRARFRQ
jgi:serine/threonine-protein kinase